ncbi:MAG: HopJ type III effector protein [Candidatus Sedimenticola sp. PURPLELP]
MTIDQLHHLLETALQSIEFDDVMQVISNNYLYTPSGFSNGLGEDMVTNAAGTNEGSCKIFAFARLSGLNEQQTLACFGRYYREDVQLNPDGEDHANIRTFMRHGWPGIKFSGTALTPKQL